MSHIQHPLHRHHHHHNRLSPERACVIMIEIFLIQIFAQCICWSIFHPISPSLNDMQFLLPSTHMLYFLIFHYDTTNWEYCCESAIIFRGPNPFQLCLILHYIWLIHSQMGQKNHQTSCFVWMKSLSYCGWLHELWCITNTIWSLSISVEDFNLLKKHILFLMHLRSSKSDAGPG